METCSTRIHAFVMSCQFLLTVSFAHAADTTDLKYSAATVKVEIAASDDIKGSVSSYLKRELRSLNNVEIVESDPEWIIHVVAMELKTVGGYKTGVAISTVIFEPFHNQVIADMFQPKFKDMALRGTSNLAWYPTVNLNVGGKDELQKLCKEIIANFDTTHLEKSRKTFRKWNEFLDKSK